MKVLLINPPRENEIIGNNPVIIEEERGHNPPLGLLSLAGYLEAHSDHRVEVIDSQVEELSYEALEERIRAAAPDAVGLTAMTMTLVDVLRTARLVKKARPGALVVLGGPHVHLFPEETIAFPEVDFLVRGEGEEAFPELLEYAGDKRRLREVKGLVFKDGERTVITDARPAIEDLDRLPFPARRLVPYQRYSSLLAKGDCVTTVFTSRGCPYRCAFCARPHLGKRFRARSPRNVVDELEECKRMGIDEFLVYDDTFTVDRERVIDICAEIVRRRLDIGFDIRARVDTISDAMLAALKRAGCRGIHYGVEAGTAKILQVLKKGITIEQAAEVFRLTKRRGIPVLAYFMIGNPTETREDIEETFRVARRLAPDYVHMTILTPFPGTEIYARGLESGVLPSDVWRAFAKNPDASFDPPHWGERFTRGELNELLVEGYRRFYLRPSYILRRLVRLRSFSEFKRKARAGLKVLGMRA
ncbi:MAG: radical SAM protein [Planctomycetota bacterium]